VECKQIQIWSTKKLREIKLNTTKDGYDVSLFRLPRNELLSLSGGYFAIPINQRNFEIHIDHFYHLASLSLLRRACIVIEGGRYFFHVVLVKMNDKNGKVFVFFVFLTHVLLYLLTCREAAYRRGLCSVSKQNLLTTTLD